MPEYTLTLGELVGLIVLCGFWGAAVFVIVMGALPARPPGSCELAKHAATLLCEHFRDPHGAENDWDRANELAATYERVAS